MSLQIVIIAVIVVWMSAYIKRIVKLSNTYYNMGLTKALNRDLSGAADALRRSVKFKQKEILMQETF